MAGSTLVEAPGAVPTLETAQRIAEVFVAEHGVAEVAVFGSVARGEATPDSDIDLVAIYPDMDYSQRWNLISHLKGVARDISGRDVDVLATDWPEWKLRSTEVTLSFEHAISDDSLVLAQQSDPYRHLTKDKIGLPMNNEEQILQWIASSKQAVNQIWANIEVSRPERAAMSRLDGDEPSDNQRLMNARRHRLRALGAVTAESVEQGLKLLVALEGRTPPKTHSAVELLNMLPNTISDDLEGFLTDEEWGRIEEWRQAGTYSDIWEKLAFSEEEVVEEIERYYNVIILVMPAAIEEFEKRYGRSQDVDEFRKDLTSLDKDFTSIDFFTGQEKEVVDLMGDETSRKLKWFRRRKRKRVSPNQSRLPDTTSD